MTRPEGSQPHQLQRLRQSLVDALEDLNLDAVDHQQLAAGVHDEVILLKIANVLLDELEEIADETTKVFADSIIETRMNEESTAVDVDAGTQQQAEADVATNWKQVKDRWMRCGWENPLELPSTKATSNQDDENADDPFQKWEQVHALATTLQLERLRQRKKHQQLPKLSLEQKLLYARDLDHLSEILIEQDSLSSQQRDLIQSAWTLFESDYDRRKQAMQQRVRILDESFQKEEEDDLHTNSASDDGEDGKAKAIAAQDTIPKATTIAQPKTLEMVLSEFQMPRLMANRHNLDSSTDCAVVGAVVDEMVVEDRGGRLQDDDATGNSGMPTWQTTEPNQTSPPPDRTGRGRSDRSHGRGGNRRNYGRRK